MATVFECNENKCTKTGVGCRKRQHGLKSPCWMEGATQHSSG